MVLPSLPPVYSAFQRSWNISHAFPRLSQLSFPLISLKWRIWHNWSASTALAALYFIAIWQHIVFLYCFQYLLFFHPPFKFRAPRNSLIIHYRHTCSPNATTPGTFYSPPTFLLFFSTSTLCEPRGWATLRTFQCTRNTHLQTTFEKNITKVLKRELL